MTVADVGAVDTQRLASIVERVLSERGLGSADLQLDIDLNNAVHAAMPELPPDIRVRISFVGTGNGPREATVDVEHVLILDSITVAF